MSERRLAVELLNEPMLADPSGCGDREAATLFVAILALLSGVHYAHEIVKNLIESPFIDFAHYYTFGNMVAMGQNPFDPQAIEAIDAQLKIRRAMAAPNYPPAFYLLMQPWVRAPFETAATAWLVFNQICLLAAITVVVVQTRATSWMRLALGAFVVLNFQPLYEDVALGQSNIVLLMLATVAWWGVAGGRAWVAALALGIAVQVKLQYAFFFVVLWWMGRRRACAGACVAAACGVLVGWSVLGAEHYHAYFSYLSSLPSYLASWTANLSLRGMMHRLVLGIGGTAGGADGLWLLSAGTVLVVIALTVPRSSARVPSASARVWGLGLVAMVFISPLTEEHHFVTLLFPLLWLVLDEQDGRWELLDWWLIVASVLLMGSLYSLAQFPEFHRGVPSLLMEGKLLGAGCLGWTLQRRLRTGERFRPTAKDA
jgi:hypothetical protein